METETDLLILFRFLLLCYQGLSPGPASTLPLSEAPDLVWHLPV